MSEYPMEQGICIELELEMEGIELSHIATSDKGDGHSLSITYHIRRKADREQMRLVYSILTVFVYSITHYFS
jgi:hypothetical protein